MSHRILSFKYSGWFWLLRVATGELESRSYTPERARSLLRAWEGDDVLNDWVQSLSPEDAARLFAILHEP